MVFAHFRIGFTGNEDRIRRSPPHPRPSPRGEGVDLVPLAEGTQSLHRTSIQRIDTIRGLRDERKDGLTAAMAMQKSPWGENWSEETTQSRPHAN